MSKIVPIEDFQPINIVDTAESGMMFQPEKPDYDANVDQNRLDSIGMSEDFARKNYDEYESLGVADPDDMDFLDEMVTETTPKEKDRPLAFEAGEERGVWSKMFLPSPQEMAMPWGYERMSAIQRIAYKAQLFAQSTMTRLGANPATQAKSGLPVDRTDRASVGLPVIGDVTFGLEGIGWTARTYMTYAMGAEIAKMTGIAGVLDTAGKKLAFPFFAKAAQAESVALNTMSKAGLKAWALNTAGKFFIKFPKLVGVVQAYSQLSEAEQVISGEKEKYEPGKAAFQGLLWATILRAAYAPFGGLRLTNANLSGKTARQAIQQAVSKTVMENPLLAKDEEVFRTGIRERAHAIYQENFGVKPTEKIATQISNQVDDVIKSSKAGNIAKTLAKTLNKDELALQNLEQRLKNNRFSFKVDSNGNYLIVNQYQGTVAKVGTVEEAKAIARVLNNGKLKKIPESLRTGKRLQAKNIGKKSFLAGKVTGKEAMKVQMQKKLDFYKEKLVSIKKQYGEYEVNRQTAADAIEEFVPKGEKEAFIKEFSKVKTNKQLSKFIDRIDGFIDRYEKKQAVDEAKTLLKYIKGNYKRGKDDFGAFDDETKKSLREIFDGLDLKDITDVHSKELNIELAKIQKTSGKIYKSMRKLKDDFPVDTVSGENIYEATIPERLITELIRLEKVGVQDLTTEDISLISKAGSMLVKAFEQKQASALTAKANKVTMVLKDTAKKIRPKKVQFKPTGGASRTVSLAKRFIHEDSQRLDTLATSIAGKDSLLYQATQDAFKGEIINRSNIERRAIEMFQQRAKDIGFNYKDLVKMNKTAKVTIGGKSYPLTRAEILSLDCTTRSKYGYNQLLKSEGIVLRRDGKDVLSGKITADELSSIVKKLSTKERNYGSIFFDINNEVTAPAVNEGSNYMWGFSAATDPMYFPIRRYFGKSVSGQTVKAVATEDMGVFKFRTGGKAAFRINPFTDTLFQTVETSAKFNGYSEPFQLLKSVLSDKGFQKGLIQSGRQAELSNMITILGRAQNIISTSSAGEKLYKGVLTRGAGSIILGNVKTLLAQAASYPSALSRLGFKNVSLKPVGRKTINKIQEHSDWLWYRWKSHNVNVELGNAAVHNRAAMVLYGEKTVKDKLGGLLIRFDQDAIGRVWNSSEKVISKTISKNSQDFYPAVARLTEKTVSESQPLWDSLFRSVNASDTGLFKRLAYIFRSPLEAQQNLLVNAINTGNKGEVVRTVGSIGASAFAYSFMRNTYDQARDLSIREIKAQFGKYQDVKTGNEFAAEVGKDTIGAMFGVIPGGREVFAVVDKLMTGYGQQGDIGDYISKNIDDVVGGYARLYKELGYKDKDIEKIALETAKATVDTLKTVSLVTGEASGFFSDINAMLRKQERKIITEIEPSTFESSRDFIKFAKFATETYERSSELKQLEKKRDLTAEEMTEQLTGDTTIQLFNMVTNDIDELDDNEEKTILKQERYNLLLQLAEGK